MRTTIVSTSKLKSYKSGSIFLISIFNIIGFCCAIVPFVIDDRYYSLICIPILIFYSIRWYRDVKKLKSVSYDESSIYYKKDGYEVQIPFEEIKEIEVVGVDIFSIKLFTPSQGGDCIWFKTSLWYPLNFKKKDEMVDELRSKIDKYKRSIAETNMAELPSFQI